uniref:Uncharacterized protein n=1 Tax=Anas platyrhynchos platyrhynchos TaxID=8840 RepID=A0A493SWE6_ANAPP
MSAQRRSKKRLSLSPRNLGSPLPCPCPHKPLPESRGAPRGRCRLSGRGRGRAGAAAAMARGRSPWLCLAGPICHGSQPTSASASAGLTSPFSCRGCRMAHSVLYADLRFAKGPRGHGMASGVLRAAPGMDEADSPYENVAPGPAPVRPAGEGTRHSPGERPEGDGDGGLGGLPGSPLLLGTVGDAAAARVLQGAAPGGAASPRGCWQPACCCWWPWWPWGPAVSGDGHSGMGGSGQGLGAGGSLGMGAGGFSLGALRCAWLGRLPVPLSASQCLPSAFPVPSQCIPISIPLPPTPSH